MGESKFQTRSFKITEIRAKGDGRFHAVANAYGVRDWYGTIFDPGCFKRSLEQRGPKRVHLWQHSFFDPIGSGDHVESGNALEVEGKLNLGVQRGRECYELMKEGDIDHMSVGFDPIKDYVADDGVQHFSECRLWESSPVTFAANELAIVDEVRAYGYGRQDLGLVLRMLEELADPVSLILSRSAAGTLTLRSREDARQAADILQDLLRARGGDPGDHSPTVALDSSRAEISDSDLRSLLDMAKGIKAVI